MLKKTNIIAVLLGLTGITASAHDTNTTAHGAILLQGDKFTCSPEIPGAAVANVQLLTCMVDHDVKSRTAKAPAIERASKLVGSVQGEKVTWSHIVSVAGISIELDTKNSAVMVSELQGKAVPRTLTVHVVRDLALGPKKYTRCQDNWCVTDHAPVESW
jgi:hypothetical protein